MSDNIRLELPEVQEKINVTVSGREQIAAIEADLKKLDAAFKGIGRGDDFGKYWKSQEALVNDVVSAVERFNRLSTKGNATELVNSFNALQGLSGKGSFKLFDNFESSVLPTLQRAQELVGKVIGGLNPESFRSAFESFSFAEKAGIELEDILKRLSTSTDTQSLQNTITQLTNDLSNARAEAEELQQTLNRYESSNGITAMREQLENTKYELEDLRTKMETEFREFLRGNNIADTNSWGWENFQGYIDNIRDGTYTAKEAISQFKVEYQHLFTGSDQGALGAEQLQNFTSKIDELMAKYEELAQVVRSGGAAGVGGGDSVSWLQPTIDALNKFAASGDSSEGAIAGTTSALASMLSILRDISGAGIENLDAINDIFRNLGRMQGLEINKTAFENLGAALSSLSGLKDLPNLSLLSNISFKGFNDLKISKASLNNLATFLPEIAKVNMEPIKQLASIDFSNFSGDKFKVNKGSMESIAKMANSFAAPMESFAKAIEMLSPMMAQDTSKVTSSVSAEAQSIDSLNGSLSTHASAMASATNAEAEKASTSSELVGALNTEASASDKAAEAANRLGESLRSGAEGVTLDNLVSKFETLNNVSPQLAEKMQQLKDAANTLKGEDSSVDQKVAAYERYKAVLGDVKALVDQQAKAEAAQAKQQKEQENALRQRQNLLRELQTEINKVEQAQRNFAGAKTGKGSESYQQLEDIRRAYQDLYNELNKDPTGSLDKLPGKLQDIRGKTDELKTSFAEVNGTLKNTTAGMNALESRFVYMFGLANVVMVAVRKIKEMINTTIELDSAMTSLRIVTDATEADYANYGQTIAKTAQEIGGNMKDLIDSTTVFARLGYSLDESGELAKYTQMLSNVGNVDVSVAQDAVTAITKAYNIAADDIEAAMDKMTVVGNNFPISVSQIAEGMNNAGSALSAAGNSFDQSVALLTAANTTVQNISKSSTGLRTITARIRKTKVELDDLGESIEEAKYQEVLDTLTGKGVSLTIGNEFRSTYDIIKDIASVWDSLTSMEQAAVAEQIAGNRQQNVFYSLVQQFSEAERAMDAMAGSAGALTSAYDEYLDSVQAHINSFKSAVQGLSQTMVSESLLSMLIDGGTKLVNILNSVFSVLNNIGGIMPVILGAATTLLVRVFPKIAATYSKIFTGAAGWAGLGVAAATMLVGVFSSIIAKQKEATKIAAQAARNYTEETNKSDEETVQYITKVRELKEQIASGELSTSELYAAQSELLSIQDELAEKFGVQASQLSLLSESAEIATQKILELAMAQKQASSSEFLSTNAVQISKAKEQMERERTYTSYVGQGSLKTKEHDAYRVDQDLLHEIQGILAQYGIELEETVIGVDNAVGNVIDQLFGSKLGQAEEAGLFDSYAYGLKMLNTTARDARQNALDAAKALRDYEYRYKIDLSEAFTGEAGGNLFEVALGKIINHADETIQEFGDTYDTALKTEQAVSLLRLSQGGSVDLTLRPIVDTSKLKEAGWTEKAGFDIGDGYATVYSSTYSNEAGTVAINFTPIMTDGAGHEIGILSPDELQEYAEEVIAGVHGDYLGLQIGSAVVGENAIQRADEIADLIHEISDGYYDIDAVEALRVAAEKKSERSSEEIRAEIQSVLAEINSIETFRRNAEGSSANKQGTIGELQAAYDESQRYLANSNARYVEAAAAFTESSDRLAEVPSNEIVAGLKSQADQARLTADALLETANAANVAADTLGAKAKRLNDEADAIKVAVGESETILRDRDASVTATEEYLRKSTESFNGTRDFMSLSVEAMADYLDETKTLTRYIEHIDNEELGTGTSFAFRVTPYLENGVKLEGDALNKYIEEVLDFSGTGQDLLDSDRLHLIVDLETGGLTASAEVIEKAGDAIEYLKNSLNGNYDISQITDQDVLDKVMDSSSVLMRPSTAEGDAKVYAIRITPYLPDGTQALSPKDFSDYIDGLVYDQGPDALRASDEKGLIVDLEVGFDIDKLKESYREKIAEIEKKVGWIVPNLMEEGTIVTFGSDSVSDKSMIEHYASKLTGNFDWANATVEAINEAISSDIAKTEYQIEGDRHRFFIHVSPVLPDGTPVENLPDYISSLNIKGSGKELLESDTLGIITDLGIPAPESNGSNPNRRWFTELEQYWDTVSDDVLGAVGKIHMLEEQMGVFEERMSAQDAYDAVKNAFTEVPVDDLITYYRTIGSVEADVGKISARVGEAGAKFLDYTNAVGNAADAQGKVSEEQARYTEAVSNAVAANTLYIAAQTKATEAYDNYIAANREATEKEGEYRRALAESLNAQGDAEEKSRALSDAEADLSIAQSKSATAAAELQSAENELSESGEKLQDCYEKLNDLYGELAEAEAREAAIAEANAEAKRKQIASVTSLTGELAAASKALQEYKDATEGEHGETANSYQSAYKQFIEDWNAGKTGSKAVSAAIKLFIPEETLRSLNYDMDAAGKLLASGFFKSIYNNLDDDGKEVGDLATNFVQAMQGMGKELDGIAAFGSKNGKTTFAYSSLTELSEAMGMTETSCAALLDMLDLYGVQVMMSAEDTIELAKSLDVNGKNLKINKNKASDMAAELAKAGKSKDEIAAIFQQLEDAGFIDTSKIKKQLGDIIAEAWEDNFKEAPEEPDYTVTVDSSQIDDAQSKLDTLAATELPTKTQYINVVKRYTGNGSDSGDDGGVPARAAGGVSGGGKTLVNEIGPELISENGRAYIAGGGKPAIVDLSKGAIVLDAEETKRAMRSSGTKSKLIHAASNGYNKSPHTQYVIYQNGRFVAVNSNNGALTKDDVLRNMVGGGGGVAQVPQGMNFKLKKIKDKSGGGGGGGAAEAAKEATEIMDWIEVAIDRIEREIESLSKKAESTLKSITTRLSSSKDEIGKITKEISLQQQGYTRYMKEANSVGLSESLKKLVQNGTIDINKYDKDTKQLIDDYKKWYDKALDCSKAVEELHEKLGELYEARFQAVQQDYENQLTDLEHNASMIEKDLDMIEQRGYLSNAEFYQKLITIQSSSIEKMQRELKDLNKYFSEAMNSGEIQEYSESWYSMKQSIADVEEAIADANIQLVEYQKTMRSLSWDYFDYAQERFGQLQEEADFLISLMENDKLFDDNGRFTSKGSATAGLRVVNYNAYMAQADEYAKEMQRIQRELAKDPYDTELIKRREELLDLQRKSILSAEDEKDAIVSLVRDGISKELEALKKLIDEYNKSLDSTKDLYEYQKKVTEQAGDVAKLEKQLAAYAGDTSEESRARIQKLNEDLKNAREALRETEQDQNISDQKKLLDDLYNEYDELLNARLDNVDELIREMIDKTNANLEGVWEEIRSSAEQVGYTITENMWAILSSSGFANYNNGFEGITAINDYLAHIMSTVDAMARASGAVKAYASGGLVDYTGYAMVHGTPGRPELMLNAEDTENFLRTVGILRQMPSVSSLSGLGGGGNSMIGEINVDFHIDHVKDYNDLISQMQGDPKFERLIGAITMDRMVGKSSFSKNKIVI